MAERRIPHGQRIEIGVDAVAQGSGRLVRAVTARRLAETHQRLAVDLQDDLVGRVDEAHVLRPGEVFRVGVAVPVHAGRKLEAPEAAVFLVALDLAGIGRTTAMAFATFPAPARQQAEAGTAFMVDDVIGIAAGIARRALAGDETRKAETNAEVDQHVLEGPHVAVGRQHRVADGIGRSFGRGDRPVEQRNAVVAFQIGGIGQDQVGIGHHFGGIGVRIDDVRNAVIAGRRVAVGEHLDGARGVHRGIPAHVRHEHEQGVDGIGIARMGVGDHHVHHAVGGDRRLPGKRLVDAPGRALFVDDQVAGPCREAERRSRQRRARGYFAGLARWLEGGRAGAREGGLVAEGAGAIDGAQQHLQDVNGATGMEAVGMGGNAAHGVHGDGPPDDMGVTAPCPVGPRLLDANLFLEGGIGQFTRDPADMVGGNPGAGGSHLGAVGGLHAAAREQLVSRPRHDAFFDLDRAGQPDADIGPKRIGGLAGTPVDGERVAVGIAGEAAVIGVLGGVDHQPWRVGIARQPVVIDAARGNQLARDGHDQKPVAARPHRHPFVGDRRIAGAHGIDRYELGAAFLEARDAFLDRVRIVVLGDAEHQEVAGAVPVGLAEFPERPADGVKPGRRHVDRTEAAMGGVIGRAELAGPPAGKGLGLVAAGEEGELARIGVADVRKPLRCDAERFVPFDFLERTLAARADALEGFSQFGGRILLHDPGGTLGAENALVHGMIGVALEIADLAVAQVNAHAAAAGTHVARRRLDTVRDGGRCFDGPVPCTLIGSRNRQNSPRALCSLI